MNKSTLVCIHIMPLEIEMFERFMVQYRKALSYLDSNDDVTVKASLNLNPYLTNWNESELDQTYFIDIFNKQLEGIKSIKEIVTDTALWGTTQQKRESLALNYDQFIFVDTDIILHEHQLKHQLNLSYQLNGMFLVSPALPKWWDESWDPLVSTNMKGEEYGFAFKKEAIDAVYNQSVTQITANQILPIKFGCGMHTLYSKEFWNFIQIPESFGGYGPEDTFGMFTSNLAIQMGYDIKQFVMDGIFITEDYTNREPSILNKVTPIDKKDEFYQRADSAAKHEILTFVDRIKQK